MNKMNIIVFSKDRSAQLDLFLNSMKHYYKEYEESKINVLYLTSNEKFEKGYNKLKDLHKNVNFLKETNFQKDLLSLVDEDQTYTVFFVDDIVWKDYFSINDDIFSNFYDERVLCLSLRINNYLNYCYPASIFMNTPEFDEHNRWNWIKERHNGDYGYPMSLDGHIFMTDEILSLLENIKYNNPNDLESKLSYNPLIESPLMVCYKDSKIINIPCNKVQTNNPNKHGNVSIDVLNENFLKGKRLSFKEYEFIKNRSCHIELDLFYEK